MRKHKDVRLSSRELFVYFHKKLGLDGKDHPVGGCTNKRLLSEKTGIEEWILMREFTRKNRCYYEDEEVIILKLYTDSIKKGKQSMARKGKGGMEKFVSYIMKSKEF